MRSDTAPPGRVRLAARLTVVSAVMVVAGGILAVVGKRSRDHVTSLGVYMAAAGLAVGLVALLVYSSTRGRRSARRRPAGHRHRATSAGPGRERRRVLDPTTVYSPGGLIDVPRDARAPGSPAAARPSGLYEPPETMRPPGSQGAREASRASMAGGAPRSGPSEARPSAARTGPPRPGYQAGAQAATGAAPGWSPPGPAGRPPHQSVPPPGWVGPGEAFPPREASPYRASPAARQAFPSREGQPPRPGPPPRPAPPPRHQDAGAPPRYGDTAAPPRHQDTPAPPRDPWRPDGPVPPFGPGHPSRGTRPASFGPAPGRRTGRPSAGPGDGAPAGRRLAPPGAAGPRVPAAPGRPASAGPGGIFGGYAQVIRATDHPGPSVNRVQPSSGRPASPPADRDIYVYRDVSDPAPTPSGRHAAADDAAYWYDLLADDHVPQHEETRGPFEPLLPSRGTPAAAEPVGTGHAQGRPAAARGEGPEAPERARARKLEQLRDLYLTAEAIGEQNVDKHFDQLLAQQRQLISEYFRQPTADKPAVGLAAEAAEAGAERPETNDPGTTGRHAGPPEGASVRAEPPRAW